MKLFILLFMFNFCYGQQSEEVFNLGIRRYIDGDYKQADSLFTLAIYYSSKTNSVTFENYYNRAMARRDLGLIESAIKDLDSSIILNPNHFASYNDLAICFYYNEEYDKCIEIVDSGLKVDSRNVDIYVLGAMACLNLNEYQKGADYCRKGKIIKRDSRLYGIQSLLHLSANKLEEGKREIDLGEKYFSLNEDIIEAQIYYYYLMNDISKMKFYYSKLSDDYPFLIKDKRFIEKISSL